MTTEALAILLIGALQIAQVFLTSMGMFILRDLRDRITRLETFEMKGGKK